MLPPEIELTIRPAFVHKSSKILPNLAFEEFPWPGNHQQPHFPASVFVPNHGLFVLIPSKLPDSSHWLFVAVSFQSSFVPSAQKLVTRFNLLPLTLTQARPFYVDRPP
jgi:hypothetical protein